MSVTTPTASGSSAQGKEFLGHPRGLVTLFMMEFFERFTYYGMRAMLIPFLSAAVIGTNPGFGIDEVTANSVYALYAGAAYLGCIPGGWVADRLIGQRSAVFYGGIFIAIGNFMLAFAGTPALFYIGLAVIVIGIGLLKPNVSAVVGALYEGQSGARRDSGFSLFYMGINLGAFVGPIIAGAIGEKWDWNMGFLTCGIATALGVLYFRFSQVHLGDAGSAPTNVPPEQRKRTWSLIAAIGVAAALGAWLLFTGDDIPTSTQLAYWMFIAQVALAVVFFGYVLFFGGLDGAEKKRIGVIVIFFLCAALFWGGFEQQATTFNKFAFDYTDRSLFGGFFGDGQHPATWYQSVNPLFIIIFAPFFAWIWFALGVRNLDPSAPAKMGLGLILLGLGFLVMMWAAELVVSSNGKVGPTWLLLAYLIHTFGELCLSPVGLSNVTKLAPPKFVGRMMGTWFLGAAIGNTIAGLAGGHLAGQQIADLPGEFLRMTLIGAGAGVLILVLSRPLRAWIGDHK
jgi:POT family proton-dependent oligopeptide transporter